MALAINTIVALAHFDLRHVREIVDRVDRDFVDEMEMGLVKIVLDALEIIARHAMRRREERAVIDLELGKARERGRLALAQISEDETQIFLHRIGVDTDLPRKAFFLGR